LAKNRQKNSVELIALVLYRLYNNFHNECVVLEGMCFVVKVALLFWYRTENNVKNPVSYFVLFLSRLYCFI